MARGPTFAPFFQRLIDDPDRALAALRADPAAFEDALLAEEQGILAANAAIPAHDALGAMLFDAGGHRVPLDGPNWLPDLPVLTPDQARPGRLLSLAGTDGVTVHAIAAPVAEAEGWNLLPAVRAAMAAHADGWLLLVAGCAVGEGPLDAACRAFGLTDLERRVVSAVVRTGSARRGAETAGLAYATVRETLGRAAKRMGVRNLPAIVHAVVAAAFGVLPAEGDSRAILTDMLPLTERQATIAALVTTGMSRDDIARATGVSAAVIKKELEVVFQTLGVASAAALSRLIAEVRALRLIARSTDSAPGYSDAALEPTRLTPRSDGSGAIAWSDYGPRSGRPVLVVHSNWGCRSVPRPFIAALHEAGFRPVAIDRPGFGATAVGRATAADPFGQAIEDALAIADRLGVERLPVVARCGAQFVVTLKHAAPDRVGPVVLVSPTPQTDEDGLRRGIVGVVKEAFYRSPRLIEFFFRIISAQMSLARVETLTRAIVAGCPADERLCDDPAFLRDRLRAIRPLSTGAMVGAAWEERIISHGGYPFPTIDAADWTVLQGQADTHNGAEEVERYWRRLLPRATFRTVPDGGRFMTSSHARLIVAELDLLVARG